MSFQHVGLNTHNTCPNTHPKHTPHTHLYTHTQMITNKDACANTNGMIVQIVVRAVNNDDVDWAAIHYYMYCNENELQKIKNKI